MKQALATSTLAACLILASGLAPAAQQPATSAVGEVRQAIKNARTEIDAFKAAGGAATADDHPAIKWAAALWAYRERDSRGEAAALASAEAVRLLLRAELWERASERVESLGDDDPAWVRLPAVLYDAGIARKDLPATIERLSRVAAQSRTPAIKAAALLIVGRAYRRQGDSVAAAQAVEAAKAAAPDTPYAEEAEGLLYEIAHLSVGLPAPPVAGKPRNGGRAITLAALRGKPVVLVFWGTT
jgi:tetratricopeptide (TPR) repeat protein